jgi:Domain of unknown function (DUF4394)
MLPFATVRLSLRLTACLVPVTLAVGCGSDSSGPNPPPAQGHTIYAVDLANHFTLFHSASPGTVDRDLAITGLLTGDRVVGIDFRPADGKLYGVGTDSRVYTVDTVTAVASPVGTSFTPALNGEHFGVVLDPATDRIRVQSAETGQNLRLDPATGQVTDEDATLAYAAGDANEASTPAIAATAVTTGPAYGIDWLLDEFVVMSDPSNGQLVSVGSTGVTTAVCAALDAAADGVVYASMTTSGVNNLYTMNVSTGAATLLGTIDVVPSIQSIAIAPGVAATTSDGDASAVAALESRRNEARVPRVAGGPKACS